MFPVAFKNPVKRNTPPAKSPVPVAVLFVKFE